MIARIRRFTYLSFSLAVAAIWLAGCSPDITITAYLHSPLKGNPHHDILAGASRVDITPLPIYPMGGYGIGGKFATGIWERLYANVVYLEDSTGTPLVFVACDLWSMPGGLADKIAERIRTQPGCSQIGREHCIIAATHTHNSPGNFSSCYAYNTLGSPGVDLGFDQFLFDQLVEKSSSAIVDAVANARPARLFEDISATSELMRNRSYLPFTKNPEAKVYISNHASMPNATVNGVTIFDTNDFRAVDPNVKVLSVYPSNSGATIPIAILAFTAVHPTALGDEGTLYSSDIFGGASMLVREHYRDTSGHQPIVAIFNGAEGDVSPNWQWQGRGSVNRLAASLTHSILSALEHRQHSLSDHDALSGTFGVRFKQFEIRDRVVDNSSAGDGCLCDSQSVPRTAHYPELGRAALGGAIDGRTIFYGPYFKEETKLTSALCDSVQGVKPLPPPNSLWMGLKKFFGFTPSGRATLFNGVSKGTVGGLEDILFWDVDDQILHKETPHSVPIGIYDIGHVRLATMPGEATTTVGLRIRKSISQSNGAADSAILIGLANEYLSYFTTPCEYREQFYEGASTALGPATEGLFLQEFHSLDRQTNLFVQHDSIHTYNAGPATNFSFNSFAGNSEWNMLFHGSLDPIINDPGDTVEGRCIIECTWEDGLRELAQVRFPMNEPLISIEQLVISASNDSTWIPLTVNVPRVDDPHNYYLRRESDTDCVDFATTLNDVITIQPDESIYAMLANPLSLFEREPVPQMNNRLRWTTTWICPTKLIPATAPLRFSVQTLYGRHRYSKLFTVDAMMARGHAQQLIAR